MEDLLQVGKVNHLMVERETPLGYMLVCEEEEVFIHGRQVPGGLEIDTYVDAFIFFDSERRLTATLETPAITVDKAAFVEVVDINNRLGAFVNIGTYKDMLLSNDDLPYDFNKWPKVGDKLYCKLKAKTNSLSAKMISRFDISKFLKPESRLARNQKVSATIIRIGEEGVNLMTNEGHTIFVYHKHDRGNHRIGEVVEVSIINVKSSQDYNGTFLQNKVDMMQIDGRTIYDALIDGNGSINSTSKTDPEIIKEKFNMSKASFKRGISYLLKNGYIEILENEIKLIDLNKDFE